MDFLITYDLIDMADLLYNLNISLYYI